jgi:hypothetical protein
VKSYTGSDLVADFIAENLASKAFLVTGGACAFIVDAIGRHKKIDYVCFQHEQAAAMAAESKTPEAKEKGKGSVAGTDLTPISKLHKQRVNRATSPTFKPHNPKHGVWMG